MGKALLVLILTLMPLHPTSAAEDVSDAAAQKARNRVIAGRVFEEIFNQGKFRVADEIYARDFVNHGIHRNFGLAEDQAAVHAEKKAFPDLRMTVNLMVAKGDLVTVVWTFRGTHTAFGYGLPPTGARIEMRGITVWRIVAGRIREEWTSYDQLSPIRQVVKHLRWLLAALLAVAMALGWMCVTSIRRPSPRALAATRRRA